MKRLSREAANILELYKTLGYNISLVNPGEDILRLAAVLYPLFSKYTPELEEYIKHLEFGDLALTLTVGDFATPYFNIWFFPVENKYFVYVKTPFNLPSNYQHYIICMNQQGLRKAFESPENLATYIIFPFLPEPTYTNFKLFLSHIKKEKLRQIGDILWKILYELFTEYGFMPYFSINSGGGIVGKNITIFISPWSSKNWEMLRGIVVNVEEASPPLLSVPCEERGYTHVITFLSSNVNKILLLANNEPRHILISLGKEPLEKLYRDLFNKFVETILQSRNYFTLSDIKKFAKLVSLQLSEVPAKNLIRRVPISFEELYRVLTE